jgi:hypothetical protein
VGFEDLTTMAQHYGQTGQPWALGDHDYSGRVDFADLVILAQRYNTSLPVPAPVVAGVLRASSTVVGAAPPTSGVFAQGRVVRLTDLAVTPVRRPVELKRKVRR